MRAADIVEQLAKKLPTFVNNFSDESGVTSLTSVGTTATAVTATAHNLAVGQQVVVSGAETPISISSFDRIIGVGTIVTASDHDATKGLNAVPPAISVSGANEAEFNGTFPLLSVTNRRTLVVSMDNSGPTSATGTPLALNVSNKLSQNYNGLVQVTAVPTATRFEYTIGQELPPATGTIIVRSNVRVSGSVTVERALQSYTKQNATKTWAFVVLGDSVASKNRNINSDSVDNQQRNSQGDAFRQQVSQNVSIYVFIPTSQEIAGRDARDLAQDLWRPICQSILFKKFDSGLFVGEYNPLQFVSHGFFAYDTAFYVHEYIFTQQEPLQFEDSIGFDEDVAFRDMDITQQRSIGTGQLTALIDLDDNPL